MIIYSIEHKESGRRYIGSAINQKRRWNMHRWQLRSNRHCNPYLQNAWNKYGEESFEFVVLETVVDVSALCEREQYWINATELKFNICAVAGSALGRPTSESTKAKLREARKGFKHTLASLEKIKATLNSPEVKARMLEMNKGRKHTPEARANMAVGRKGRRPSDETRRKMSEAHKGYIKSEEHRQRLSIALTGKTKRPETIEKLRQAGKARFSSPEAKEKLREMAFASNAARRAKKIQAGVVNG